VELKLGGFKYPCKGGKVAVGLYTGGVALYGDGNSTEPYVVGVKWLAV
jgi:hypothetical protein